SELAVVVPEVGDIPGPGHHLSFQCLQLVSSSCELFIDTERSFSIGGELAAFVSPHWPLQY
ncbi:hypothetical protein A2U01_0059918, partial [Trifolium medium]|nr:hypothetical protein [Trifolium medium]